MITSNFEYLLISELISMPDRQLAEKIELHIWYNCPTPQPRILAAYLTALRESEGPVQFYESCEKLVERSGLEFITTGDGMTCRTRSYKPPGYVEITVQQLEAAEEQEPV